MQLNVKFLQILFTKIISIFFTLKIQFLKSDIQHFLEHIFASTTANNKDGEKKSTNKM